MKKKYPVWPRKALPLEICGSTRVKWSQCDRGLAVEHLAVGEFFSSRVLATKNNLMDFSNYIRGSFVIRYIKYLCTIRPKMWSNRNMKNFCMFRPDPGHSVSPDHPAHLAPAPHAHHQVTLVFESGSDFIGSINAIYFESIQYSYGPSIPGP